MTFLLPPYCLRPLAGIISFQTFLIYQHEFYTYDLILASLLFQYLLQH